MNEMKLIGEYLGLDRRSDPMSESEFHARRNRMTEIATTLSQSDDQDVQAIGVAMLVERRGSQHVRNKIDQLLRRKPQV